VAEDLKQLWGWAREKWLPVQPWSPLLASGMTLGAGFCKEHSLRILLLCLAVGFFLAAAADFARSLLDRESGNASDEGPPERIPVTWQQVVLAAVLALLYFFMIFAGFNLLFLPSGFALVFMIVGVLAVSSLAAWRNVRLWWREGADYEQALKEEEQISHNLRIPPVR
jgi:hypothetical protein